MPTQILNSSSVSYGFGKQGFETIVSNTTSTELLDLYSITQEFGTLSPSFRPGENVTFYVKLENNGLEKISSINVVHDLGGDNPTLSYCEGSAILIKNGKISRIDPARNPKLNFILTESLLSKETEYIMFEARVNSGYSGSSLLSSISVGASNENGQIIENLPKCSSLVIPVDEYAKLTILRSVNVDTIVPKEKFSISLVLSNTGNAEAKGVVVRDSLPNGFKVSSLVSKIGEETIRHSTTDYTIDKNTNTLIFPVNRSKGINIPPSTNGSNGCLSIIINGSVE